MIVTTPDATRAQEGGSSKFRRMVRWMFVNRRKGGITVAQWPNVALSVFIALSVARRLNIAKGTPQTTLRLLSVVAILVWAADELIRGVSPFRRILGLGASGDTTTGPGCDRGAALSSGAQPQDLRANSWLAANSRAFDSLGPVTPGNQLVVLEVRPVYQAAGRGWVAVARCSGRQRTSRPLGHGRSSRDL